MRGRLVVKSRLVVRERKVKSISMHRNNHNCYRKTRKEANITAERKEVEAGDSRMTSEMTVTRKEMK